MNLINISVTNRTITEFNVPLISYAPDKQCFDWCLIQQVMHSNNIELYAVMFVVFAYLFIVAYSISDEIKILKPFKENFIYYAKLLLILFFGFYILIIRMRLIW